MPVPGGQPSPLSNVTANTGFQIATCRKATHIAQSNNSKLYQRKIRNGKVVDMPVPFEVKNQTLGLEPAYTTENEQTFAGDDQPMILPVLTALNGLPAHNAKAVDRMIRWIGFVRDETAQEHVPGNSNGGLVVIMQGFLTVVHTGVRSISAGALVCLRAPTEEEAALQVITGRSPNKAIGLLEEYQPQLDAMDAANGFASLAKQMGAPLKPRVEREMLDDQIEAFELWWQSQRVQFATFFAAYQEYADVKLNGVAVKKAREDSRRTFMDVASALGLVGDGKNALMFQQLLLKRLFARDVFDGVPDESADQLFFPLETAMSVDGPSTELDLARMQKTAVENGFNAIIGAHARRINSIIGKTPTGGVPGGDLDLAFKGCIGQ